METKKVYLIRHGSVVGASGDRRYLGHHDTPLDPKGQRQAARLGQWLQGRAISRIFCSDLSRTLATAAAIGSALEIAVESRSALREVNLGDWDGRQWKDIAAHYPEEVRRRNDDLMGHRPPGGESFNDCAERIIKVFQEILCLAAPELALVAHAGVNRLLLCHLLGVPRKNMFCLAQDYGCLNILQCGEWGCQVELLNYCPRREASEDEFLSPL